MQRFFSKIKVLDNGCWEWTSNKARGYGHFKLNKKTVKTHRLAYEMFYDKIPNGMSLDHLCRNRGCCNPIHLEPVTIKENIMRGEGIAAKNSKKTDCKYGHPFDKKNTYFYPNGKRLCRICNNTRPWKN